MSFCRSTLEPDKVTAKRGQLLTVAGGALSSTPDPGPGANLSFKFTRVT